VAKIINTSDKPFEFTFDSGNYGPIQPGEVVDYPAEVAAHAIKRSEIIDPDFGETVGFQLIYLGQLSQEEIRKHVVYPCPFVQSNQCDAKSFKTIEDLHQHMETHWGAAPVPEAPGAMKAMAFPAKSR
jgi:hypothetical protein